MPTFPTPGPVALRIRNGAGRVHVTPVAELTESSVELTGLNDAGRSALEQTIVDHHGDTLSIEIPSRSGLFGRSPSVAVDVRIPAASTLMVSCGSADLVVDDGLRTLQATSGSGDVRIGHVTGDAQIRSGSGDVSVTRIDGSLSVGTGSGDITVDEPGPDAVVGTGSGDVRLRDVAGTVTTKTGSGDVRVTHLAGHLEAKSGSGDAAVEQARDGSIKVRTASGEVAIGVAPGTAAWLDVNTVTGRIDQQLDEREPPAEDQPRLTISVTTVSGDVAIRRS